MAHTVAFSVCAQPFLHSSSRTPKVVSKAQLKFLELLEGLFTRCLEKSYRAKALRETWQVHFNHVGSLSPPSIKELHPHLNTICYNKDGRKVSTNRIYLLSK